MTEQDVNAQHLAAMGLADQPLGQAYEQATQEEQHTRCDRFHPEAGFRCARQAGHEGRHARAGISWDPQPEPLTEAFTQSCDDVMTLLPHEAHTYVVGGIEFTCPGYGAFVKMAVDRKRSQEEMRAKMLLVEPASSGSMRRFAPSGRCHAALRSPKDSATVLWCEQDEGHPGEHQAGERSWSVPTKQREGDQPLPTGGQQCVQDLVIAAMEESKRVGLERYGSTLQTFNGRRGIQDVAEEARDLMVYLTQIQAEAEADRQTLVDVVRVALLKARDEVPAAQQAIRRQAVHKAAEVAVDAIMGWVAGQRAGAR